MRKAANLFRILENIMTFNKTVRKYVPPLMDKVMDSSGYFVYDELYSHTDGMDKYRELLKV
jgi:hypothetical protein